MLFQEEKCTRKRQAKLPTFESISVQRKAALKTNLPLIGLLCADSTKTFVKAGNLTF